MKQCPCGSGQERYELKDGYGVFMCFVCSACYESKRKKFRPDIFTRYKADEPIDPEEYY